MQDIILIILFLGAVGFLVRKFYLQYQQRDSGCGSSCGCDSAAKQHPMASIKPRP